MRPTCKSALGLFLDYTVINPMLNLHSQNRIMHVDVCAAVRYAESTSMRGEGKYIP